MEDSHDDLSEKIKASFLEKLNSKDWSLVEMADFVTIHSLQVDGAPTPAFRSEFLVSNEDPLVVFKLLNDLESRLLWDSDAMHEDSKVCKREKSCLPFFEKIITQNSA